MKTSVKRIGAAIALLGVTASLAGCGGKPANQVEPGTVNTNTDQTEFNIISGPAATIPTKSSTPWPRTPAFPSPGTP